MSTPELPVHHYEFVEDASCPLSDIRKWLRACLARQRVDVVADVALLVTELVTNAYEHAGGVLGLRLSFPRRDVTRVEVDDASDDTPPSTLPIPSLNNSRGRGLPLVEALSTSWGVTRWARHKTIWAEVALS